MFYKSVAIFIVLAVFIGGGFFWYSSQVRAPETAIAPVSSFRGPTEPPSIKGPTEPPPQPAPTPTSEPRTWVVDFVNGAFEPREINVIKGDTVKWVNRSAVQAWPASAIHPTHQVYPGFDALRALGTGESYSFVFDRVGSWRYHDHLSPAITGTVNVLEQQSE